MFTAVLLLLGALPIQDEPRFVDLTDALGLTAEVVPETVSRVRFADLNGDRYPDLVLGQQRVFLNRADGSSPIGRAFVEVPPAESGLREAVQGTLTVFCDLDGDGVLDAFVSEYVDARKPGWEEHGRRTSWQKGRGDGTFGEPRRVAGLREATTCAVAAGDVDRDGRLDLWLGHWYVQYGALYLGYPGELALAREAPAAGTLGWDVLDLPRGVEQPAEADPNRDGAGRPTYGAMIAELDGEGRPELIELNYGRRWNRLYRWSGDGPGSWVDHAPMTRFDGDDRRHGLYPDWVIESFRRRDPPIEREPEMPFRSNGNSFDCAQGDIDGDGDFDLFVAEITHGWAGSSSDRSRFLVNRLAEHGQLGFEEVAALSVDRIPEDVPSWNQGDLFCELADLDQDGRLDLLLSSGDYPDDQRLRVFLQGEDGTFADSTAALGVDHDGSQQLSLADVDGDGDLDVLVGQTFFRYTEELKAGRRPRPRLWINEASAGGNSLVLYLEGDGISVNSSALGAVARVRVAEDRIQVRQLCGIGGHAGKQQGFLLHFGLGQAEEVLELEVTWPDAAGTQQVFEQVAAGRYALRVGGELEALGE